MKSVKTFGGSYLINVDTKDEGTVYLVLNNVEIASSKTAPINIMEAKDACNYFAGSDLKINKSGKYRNR